MRAEKHARFECFVPACARVAVTCSLPEHRFERHRFAAAVSVAVEAMTLEARRINDARRGALPRGFGADACSVRIARMRQENTSERARHAFLSGQPTLCATSPEVGTLPYPCGSGCEAIAAAYGGAVATSSVDCKWQADFRSMRASRMANTPLCPSNAGVSPNMSGMVNR